MKIHAAIRRLLPPPVLARKVGRLNRAGAR